jgi:hypothetical protein
MVDEFAGQRILVSQQPQLLTLLWKVLAYTPAISSSQQERWLGTRDSRNALRTRHTQSLTQLLSPHAANIFEAVYHVRTSSFRFPFFELPIPVASLNVSSPLFCLLILSLPLMQLFFACA